VCVLYGCGAVGRKHAGVKSFVTTRVRAWMRAWIFVRASGAVGGEEYGEGLPEVRGEHRVREGQKRQKNMVEQGVEPWTLTLSESRDYQLRHTTDRKCGISALATVTRSTVADGAAYRYESNPGP